MTVYRFGGFWRRLIAFSIDNIIITFIFSVFVTIALLSFFSGAVSGHKEELLADLVNPTSVSRFKIAFWLFYIFINVVYFTYFHGVTGRTPGKRLLSLQVVSDEGAPISLDIAFLRATGYLVSLIFYLVGFIWIIFDSKKQGWHDKIAGTVVIIREKEKQSAGISIPDESPAALTAPEVKPPENNSDYAKTTGPEN
jgi:uncharacterized RDD family membrane protein YckC